MNALDLPIARTSTARASISATERLAAGIALVASLAGLAVGGAALATNDADGIAIALTGVLGLSALALAYVRRRRLGSWNRAGVILAIVSLIATAVLVLWPEYLYGAQLNGIIHRSVFSGPTLLALSVVGASHALRSVLGGTPAAEDLSLYPIIALPVALALVAYGLVLSRVVGSGLDGVSFELLTREYRADFDAATGVYTYQAGLRNHLFGTLLLMVLTSAIAFLPGLGAGVFMSEYPGRLANFMSFCTTMLRAMSVFIIGVTAFSVVGLVPEEAGTPLSDLIRGSVTDQGGFQVAARGSYVTAALFLALLVIPVIARLTEEGLRSVPREIREASVALGATEGYGLRRVLLPWAGPNIITGLMLGAAEATGSLAILIFIAGTGESGVEPLGWVTSLDVALFQSIYGTEQFETVMGPYRFTSALLLLAVTLALTLAVLALRQRFGKRYRGSLTSA
jgi:phosphate transport system permease protein